ncbi:uncharacterized protein LOC132178122 [Corylus avellana]|uniref:uncharacterized protein LOC132178122 n=1 Tax=Corylus avellana TaxID=13451 RepID=UPI00286CBEBC|nr:uncharacterized protein LOC132178122 [Corylus avellana]
MEHVNTFNDHQKQSHGLYFRTYNLGWWNHPNFSWKQNQLVNQGGAPHHAHNQYPPRFPSVQTRGRSAQPSPSPAYQAPTQVLGLVSQLLEETLKDFMKMAGQSISEVRSATMVNTQAIAKLESQMGQITSHLGEREKGKFPSQPVPNPKGQCAVGSSSNPTHRQEQQVPSYAKFLKDLTTIKRKTNVLKKAFLTEQVSSILQCKLPIKYKDLGCPTISCMIGVSRIERALLDFGVSVNLLPYSVYLQLGLGELKPTLITLQLGDKSVKVPQGIIEDVLIKVDKFHFPVDFIVLDTEPVSNVGIQIPIILGRPFLATANALINCRTGIMKVSFDNMTVELNIFHSSKQPLEFEEVNNVCAIEEIIEDTVEETSMEDHLESCLAQFGEDLNLEKLLEQADAILENGPLVSNEEEEAAVHEPPKKELKPLLDTLKYKFLDLVDSLPVIIASDLVGAQEEKLLDVLREHKEAIGWTIEDIKGISPLVMVERLVGHYSGYNQIPMDPENQEKTTFTCPFGTFTYCHIPFGLCNAPATFQQCMMSIFSDMVEHFLEFSWTTSPSSVLHVRRVYTASLWS